ncbi:GGDEF domain-containing protein [Roseovarius gaetbuli]|nr:GGDEF domain-containing protein [Roseovarius gaetbuli]
MRVKSQREVRFFAAAVSLVVLLGSLLLRVLILPPDLAAETILPGSLMAVMISAPIAFFVGQRMLEVHEFAAKLEQAVYHDLLTGVCTRARFHERVTELGDESSVVIVADIDHFKGFNDQYGHHAGDLALRQFAAILAENCRADDIVARFGGEEFVVLLRDTSLSDGLIAAERLGRRVRQKPVFVDQKALSLTASFGVAVLPPGGNAEAAIQQADRALYHAKHEGRDRAYVYDPARDAGPLPANTAAE